MTYIYRLYPAIEQESQSQCLIDNCMTTNFIISFYRQRSGIYPIRVRVRGLPNNQTRNETSSVSFVGIYCVRSQI